MNESSPNIVLLSLDSLRSDHLPTHGYSRNTAPTLSELAEQPDVTVFENAYAPTAWTLPSHTSLFTGLPTDRHGVYDEGLRVDPDRTLAAKLSGAGYDTAAFLNNGWLTNGGVTDAFDHRFDIFDEGKPSGVVDRNLNRLRTVLSMQDSGVDRSIERFREWIGSSTDETTDSAGDPFFAFFHLMEPHYLYNPTRPCHKQYVDQSTIKLLFKQREIYTERGRYFAGETSISEAQMNGFVDQYDSEIRYLDAKLNALFEALRDRELFDDSLIIIVGDHGELFGEHNLIGHHFSLSEEILRVPIIVKWPDGGNPTGKDRSDAFVNLSNVFKTILNHSPATSASEREFVSLEEQHARNNRRIFAHYRTPQSMLDSFRDQTQHKFEFEREYDTSISVVRDGSEKLVVTDEDVRLYDLNTRDGEAKNIKETNEGRVEELRKILNNHLASESIATDSSDGFSDGVQQQLKDLGYI